MSAAPSGQCSASIMVPQIPANAITEPTERSIPPEIITSVIPSDMTVMTAD